MSPMGNLSFLRTCVYSRAPRAPNLNIYSVNIPRTLFHWVNLMFNRVSKDRIKEVGPDQACAEWLLRNGAHIQWKGSGTFITDYNELPLDELGQRKGTVLHLVGVYAKGATIMAYGFPHFKGCLHLERITLENCNLLSNAALPLLHSLENSLSYLEINSCHNFSDEGLFSLAALRNLKVLKLKNLQAVKDKKNLEKQLKSALPNTQVSFNGD